MIKKVPIDIYPKISYNNSNLNVLIIKFQPFKPAGLGDHFHSSTSVHVAWLASAIFKNFKK